MKKYLTVIGLILCMGLFLMSFIDAKPANEISEATSSKKVNDIYLKSIKLYENEWLVFDVDGIVPNSQVTVEITARLYTDPNSNGAATLSFNLNNTAAISSTAYNLSNGFVSIPNSVYQGKADANGILKIAFIINGSDASGKNLTFTDASYIRVVYDRAM